MKTLLYSLCACLFLAHVPAAVAQTRLSPDLQKKFPGLRLQAKVATKRDNVDGSFYMQTMTISPSVVVEGAATQPQPAMEATMIIIAMDTRAKYTERREQYMVHAAQSIPIPAVDKANKREFDFKSSKTRFDSYRDSSNVGGAVYKWYIFGVRDAESKQLLHFETNCTDLAKHVASKPDNRDKYLSLSQGTLFEMIFK